MPVFYIANFGDFEEADNNCLRIVNPAFNSRNMCLKSPVIRYITENAVGPVCATTCNISTQPEIHTFVDAVKYFGDVVDLIIGDDSLATYGIPTTIVSFVEDRPTVLRTGGFPPMELKEKYISDLIIESN